MVTRTRFAPSPTGALHVGGVRTALFAWLVARQAGGQFILRLEDTDQAREVSGADQQIINSLRALNLDYDEGPDIGGQFAPYRQSQRLPIYKHWAEKLIEQGRAYADPYSKEELDNFRRQAVNAKQPFLFRNHRPANPPAWDGTQPLRLKSEPKAYSWHDEVMGEIMNHADAIDDFILMKSDGYPTYNFAHIVDDAEMQISHVIRGQEFLPSVPDYLNLYEALGISPPILATMPHILGPSGSKKLSKRDGARDVLDYIRDGFLPEALISFIATLGWNDGSEQEIFSRDELIKRFSLAKVQKSGARFDEQRLLWMNGTLLRQMQVGDLEKRIEASEINYWGAGASADAAKKREVLGLIQERLKYLGELESLTYFFFDKPPTAEVSQLLKTPADKGLQNLGPGDMRRMLEAVSTKLETSNFEGQDIKDKLNQLLEELATKPAVLFPLIRVAVTGAKFSPEIFGTLAVLGKSESLSRLREATSLLDA